MEACDAIRLDNLRTRLRNCVPRALKSLWWFAERYQTFGAIPPNTWRDLDRPYPHRPRLIDLAMDVQAALIAAERFLRTAGEGDERRRDRNEVVRLSGLVRKRLERTFEDISAKKCSEEEKHLGCPRPGLLAADHVHGTLSLLGAANALSAEVFQCRSGVTPSYVAGTVILTKLRVGRRSAQAHANAIVGDTLPRISTAATAVLAMDQYAAHLEQRSSVFGGIGAAMEEIARLNRAVNTAAEEDARRDCSDALAKHLLVTVPRLAASFREAGSLIKATEDWFKASAKRLGSGGAKDVTGATLLSALEPDNAEVTSAGNVRKQQKDARDAAKSHRDDLTRWVKDVALIVELLVGSRWQSRPTPNKPVVGSWLGDVHDLLGRHQVGASAAAFKTEVARCAAERGANKLDVTWRVESCVSGGLGHVLHEALRKLWESHAPRERVGSEAARQGDELWETDRQYREPSITDLSRFRFLHQLANALTSDDAASKLKSWMGLFCPKEALTKGDVATLLSDLGKSKVARGMVAWWQNHADVHAGVGLPDWIQTRHKSFECAEQFQKAIGLVKGHDPVYRNQADKALCLSGVAGVFKTAAGGFLDAAKEVRRIAFEEAGWCIALGRHLLLECVSGASDQVDPQELASLLLLADRLGEPWEDSLEIEACKQLAGMQRKDGGFPAITPDNKFRGFTYCAPSVETIFTIARFLTCRTASLTWDETRVTLERWLPIVTRCCEFVIHSQVGAHSGDLAGWQTDRVPERDRIDCRVTAMAVRAVCLLDEVLTDAINHCALTGISVARHKPNLLRDAVAADCGAREPYYQRIQRAVDALRERTQAFGFEHANAIGFEAEIDHATIYSGPPGTGKTYTPEAIAGELGWPLATIKMGDFHGEGDHMVAKAAVDLFKRLSLLSRVVVLFDEFDEMVAVRGIKSGSHHGHSNALTATMLPLMNDLHRSARRRHVLIAITTNLLSNIDPAAKRVGRVDHQQEVLFPDRVSRCLQILRKWVGKQESIDDGALLSTLLGGIVRLVTLTGLRGPKHVTDVASLAWESKTCDVRVPARALEIDHYQAALDPAGTEPTVETAVRSEVGRVMETIGTPRQQEECLGQSVWRVWEGVRSPASLRRQKKPGAGGAESTATVG